VAPESFGERVLGAIVDSNGLDALGQLGLALGASKGGNRMLAGLEELLRDEASDMAAGLYGEQG
jgi:hypothetical protein